MVVVFNYFLKEIIQFLKYYFNKLLGGFGSPASPNEAVLTITSDKFIKNSPNILIDEFFFDFIAILPF